MWPALSVTARLPSTSFFFFQAEDGIRDLIVTGVQTCALPISRAQIVGILIGATLVAGVGILDDQGLLHHQVKLFAGMPLAAAILLVSGIRAQIFSVLVGGRSGDFLDAVLTVVWVVGITASFSILDHMDGLC